MRKCNGNINEVVWANTRNEILVGSQVSLVVVKYTLPFKKNLREWPATATITIDTPPDFIDMGEYSNSCYGVNKKIVGGLLEYVESKIAFTHQRVNTRG